MSVIPGMINKLPIPREERVDVPAVHDRDIRLLILADNAQPGALKTRRHRLRFRRERTRGRFGCRALRRGRYGTRRRCPLLRVWLRRGYRLRPRFPRRPPLLARPALLLSCTLHFLLVQPLLFFFLRMPLALPPLLLDECVHARDQVALLDDWPRIHVVHEQDLLEHANGKLIEIRVRHRKKRIDIWGLH